MYYIHLSQEKLKVSYSCQEEGMTRYNSKPMKIEEVKTILLSYNHLKWDLTNVEEVI